MAAGLANPGFAKTFSSLNSVFNYFYQNKALTAEYIQYAQGVNQTVSDRGVAVTVSEIACDDSNINIGYTVRTDQAFDENTWAGGDKEKIKLKIDGRDVTNSMSISTSRIDAHNLSGLLQVDTAGITLPENFKLNMEAQNILGIDGDWQFKLDVSKAVIMSHIARFAPDLQVNLEGAALHMDKVLFSPLNTTLVFSLDKKDLPAGLDPKALTTVNFWKLVDDRGHEIQYKDTNGGVYSPDDRNTLVYQMNFDGVEEIPHSLTVTPQEYHGDTLVPREDLTFTIPLDQSNK